MRTRISATAVAILSLTAGNITSQPPKSASSTTYGTLYLVGNRQVTRIGLQSGVKKEWPLLAVVGMHEEGICSARHAPMTCHWSAFETLLDAANKRLYFAAPTTAPGDNPESDADGSSRGPFAVWAVDLPTMKLLHKFDVLATPGSMILASEGKQLLVSYEIRPLTVDTFDTATFAKISSVKNAGRNQLDTYFDPESYFLPDGKFIVSGGVDADFCIRVTSGRFQREFVDPRAQLSTAEKQKLSEFVKTERDGQKLLPCVPASSRNGKTLVFVANREMTKTAFWTVDMETGATSAATITDRYAATQLIGSGDEFAAFEGQMSRAPGGNYDFARLGRIAIYNCATGKLMREFNKPDLMGAGAVLCLSPDGSLAAYAQGRKASILDFNSCEVKPLTTVTDRPEPGYYGSCGFTE